MQLTITSSLKLREEFQFQNDEKVKGQLFVVPHYRNNNIGGSEHLNSPHLKETFLAIFFYDYQESRMNQSPNININKVLLILYFVS